MQACWQRPRTSSRPDVRISLDDLLQAVTKKGSSAEKSLTALNRSFEEEADDE